MKGFDEVKFCVLLFPCVKNAKENFESEVKILKKSEIRILKSLSKQVEEKTNLKFKQDRIAKKNGEEKNIAKEKVRRGQIYFVSDPNLKKTVGEVQLSNRPAVIVSNNKGNMFSNVVEIVYLTSKPKTKLPTHVLIGEDQGLKRESIALCEQVLTVHKDQLENYIGKLNEKKMREIDEALLISLGLTYLVKEARSKAIRESRRRTDEI